MADISFQFVLIVLIGGFIVLALGLMNEER